MEFVVPGKWILSGEHAVLRGVPALVFPLKSSVMHVTYENSLQPLQLNLSGTYGDELKLLAWGVLENAAQRLNKNIHEVTGVLEINSSLPMGTGLGASAALCVAMSRCCHHLGWVSEDQLFSLSRNLENLFHGESSGVDVAVALRGTGLKFVRQVDSFFVPSQAGVVSVSENLFAEKNLSRDFVELQLNWKPALYLSYCGQRGMTAECVTRVKSMWEEKPQLAKKIDLQMAESVSCGEQALRANQKLGMNFLINSMNLAADCFKQWGLSEGAVEQHILQLKSLGALATKPTGSGGGGYILSLWNEKPPQDPRLNFISCF
ncbi:MAG: hypothetical protein K1X29_03095 [Bdellovibrionales bacterium]|nr:hypothetical protein [Bdellovibrionales bacterium]